MQIIEADLTWTGTSFERGVRVAVRPDGRISAVGDLPDEPTLRLTNEALIPGMVNAHSHAFQIGLRRSVERFPAGASGFSSWREEMYKFTLQLDAATFSSLTRQAFSEMRRTGITTVGEFHYLHHTENSWDFAFDQLVLDAASSAGIRIVLLNVHYRTGAIGAPLNKAQSRFDTKSIEAYWEQLSRLEERLGPAQTLGCAAHSIRAVPLDEIAALHEEATSRGMVFHMHVEEQQDEIDEAVTHLGHRPMEIINDRLEVMGNLTAVHCTRTRQDDLERFVAKGGMICINPLTKANLGDGVQSGLAHASRNLAIGSDSNIRIGMLEEMRWLEYSQRLASEARGVLTDGAGRVATTLFRAATSGGASSLGLNVGRIAPGCPADLATIDLASPVIEGWSDDNLLDMMVFGASDDIVLRTCVDGSWLRHRESALS